MGIDVLGVIVFIIFVVLSAIQKFMESREEGKSRRERAEQRKDRELHPSTREILFGEPAAETEDDSDWQPVPPAQRRSRTPRKVQKEEEEPYLFGPTPSQRRERQPAATQRREQQATRRQTAQVPPQREAAPERRSEPSRRQQPPTPPQRREHAAPSQQQPPAPPRRRAHPSDVRGRKPQGREHAQTVSIGPTIEQTVSGRAERRRRKTTHPKTMLFDSIRDVRRGIILQEVLGPPKSLQ